jgi:hypothetical protein
MPGRVKALVLLALALIRTAWRLSWGVGRAGLARFRENYAADGLTAVSPEQRSEMREFGRCIACGRCNRGDGPLIVASRGRFQGTMGLVLAASRSMPDYAAAAQVLAYLNDDDLQRKEALCPTRVPLRRLAAFVQAHAGAARVSVPRARGAKRMPSSFPPSDSRPNDPQHSATAELENG